MSPHLADVATRVAAGEPLTDAEMEALASARNLLVLGAVADALRRRRHGDRVTFVRVAEVRVTDPGPVRIPSAAREVRLVGAPASLDAALACVRSVAAVSGGVPVTGFSLADLDALVGRDPSALAEGLVELRAAGLALVAEAPADRLQDPGRLFDAVRQAGLRVARVTLREVRDEDRLTCVRRVAAWGPAASVACAFAPLPCVSDSAGLSTGYDDVKQVALARLLVDNIASIQVDWASYGPKLAQVALIFGADDVDGVSPVDTLELGARRSPLEEIRRHIRAASLVPVERNGRFETQ